MKTMPGQNLTERWFFTCFEGWSFISKTESEMVMAMSNMFLKKIFICVFSLFNPAAFAELPVFNRNPVTSNSTDDLLDERFYLKVYEAETAKGKISIQNVHRTTYYGKVKIGSDDQEFKVDFDTGSSVIWVPGADCSSPACSVKNRFDPQSSWSFASYGHKFDIKYGMGASGMAGIIGYDDITIGGIKVLSQGFVVANAVSNSYYHAPYDGIFGLAQRNDATSWLDNAVQQGLINRAVFSFYLSNTPNQGGSVMIVGDPDPSYYQGRAYA